MSAITTSNLLAHCMEFCMSSYSRKIVQVQERALGTIFKSKMETYEELIACARLQILIQQTSTTYMYCL